MYVTTLVPTKRIPQLYIKITKLADRIKEGKTDGVVPTITMHREVFTRNHKLTSERDLIANPREVTSSTWVTILYVPPMINGWFLTGVYSDESGSWFCDAFNGEVIPEKYLASNIDTSECEHCKLKRSRKKLLLLQNDGEYTVVGTSCLKDYIGHQSAAQLIAYQSGHDSIASMLSADIGPHEAMSEPYLNTKHVINLSAALIREYGFQKSASNNATGKTCYHIMMGNYMMLSSMDIDKTIEPYDCFALCQEWLSAQTRNNNYIDNLRAAMKLEYVSQKRVALLASLPHIVFGALREAQERKIPTVASQYIGVVKDRLTDFSATIKQVQYAANHFGEITYVTMVTKNGEVLSWKASKRIVASVGDVWNVSGATVVRHRMFKNVDITDINRVKYSQA